MVLLMGPHMGSLAQTKARVKRLFGRVLESELNMRA
jgi:hypothetical protein